VAELALSAARVLGKSRKLAVFGGLVAVAGLVNELRDRREARLKADRRGKDRP
jgi:hypothetical protein